MFELNAVLAAIDITTIGIGGGALAVGALVAGIIAYKAGIKHRKRWLRPPSVLPS